LRNSIYDKTFPVSPRAFFVLTVVLIYILPVLFLLAGIIPFAYRFHTLLISSFIIGLLALLQGYSLKDLGIKNDVFIPSIKWNIVLLILLAIPMLIICMAGAIRQPDIPEWAWFFVFYVLVSSPIQEFAFRGFLFAIMRHAGIMNSAYLILNSALIYCIAHIFYQDILTTVVTFVMGIIWGYLYYKYPNIWGVSLSHAVLGALAILVGII
jgi:hypothetical protein